MKLRPTQTLTPFDIIDLVKEGIITKSEARYLLFVEDKPEEG